MGEATREFAIAETMEILRAYVRKIEDAKGYLDCLLPEGRQIVEDYDKNADGQRTLLLKASGSEDFFSGMPDEAVLAYADVCRKMNDRFELNVKEVYPIERLAADKKGFWETLWGALQGEFNEDPSGSEILIDMGLNFIPLVGQACDARDIAACLKKLVIEKRASEAAIWVTLLLTAIGCVPYAGDVVKAGCKAILKGADDIFFAVLKKIDAEDAYGAFVKFRLKFVSSIDKAVEMVCKWIEEARKSKYGSKVDSVLASAGENLCKAEAFVTEQIGEFEERVFKIGKAPKPKVKSVADIGSLEKMIPSKYCGRAKDLISNMPEKQRQEVTEYIEELYRKHGDPKKTMQEHHWIEQSRIKDRDTYPFLGSPPMKEDLLKSKSNLSLIVGHNGGHKREYNDLLDKNLKYINDFLEQQCMKQNISIEKLMQNNNIKTWINRKVEETIVSLQDAVEKDHKIMNNVEKMFILD